MSNKEMSNTLLQVLGLLQFVFGAASIFTLFGQAIIYAAIAISVFNLITFIKRRIESGMNIA